MHIAYTITPPPGRDTEAWPGLGGLRHLPREWHERRAKFQENCKSNQGAVCFFGDSITEKWSRKLSTAFRPLKTVNRGISGDTTRGMLFRMAEDVLTLNAKALVILAGINDLDVYSKPEDIACNIKQILDSFQGPTIVCSILPHKNFVENRPTEIIETNTLLKNLGVPFVDAYGAFLTKQGDFDQSLFTDLVHPNEAGYKVLKNAIGPVLAKVIV